jgi:hypothetical protein
MTFGYLLARYRVVEPLYVPVSIQGAWEIELEVNVFIFINVGYGD